jgi:hypothetical protein
MVGHSTVTETGIAIATATFTLASTPGVFARLSPL